MYHYPLLFLFNVAYLDKSMWRWDHLNKNPVIPGHGEEDLTIEELNIFSDLLGNTAHQAMKEPNCLNVTTEK